MEKTLREQVQETLIQQGELRKKAAAVWNMEVVRDCDRQMKELSHFLQSPMLTDWI